MPPCTVERAGEHQKRVFLLYNNLATIYSLLSGHIYLTVTAGEIFLMETEQVDRLIKGFSCLAIQELQICSENVKLK